MATNVIAIDGPAASGKSSVAKKLAAKLNIVFVSTGALYRAIAWKAIRASLDTETLGGNKEILSRFLLPSRQEINNYDLKIIQFYYTI